MPNPLNVPITPPRVAFIDPRSGNVSREWYLFFLSLFQTAGGSSITLDDVQKGPPALTIDEINANIEKAAANLRPSTESSTEQIAELRKQIEALEVQVRPELGTMASLQQDNVPWLQFDTTPSGMPTGANAHGTLYWDDADGIKTLNLVMEDSGGVVQQIGEETFYRIKADAAITNGQVVMFTGTVGASGALKGAPATGLTATQNEYIMGVATQDIANNGWGYVTWFGLVRGINTTGGAEAWVDGQILYYNPAVPGGLTKTVPTAPNPKVIVASVVHAASNGSLFVRPTFGSALGSTDSNVQIGTLANGNLLIYNASTSRWENATLTAGTNVTITNGPGSITINSSNPGGTVTSVGLSAPTGFSVSGSPVTSSGTLALSFASGYSLPTNASQTNWDTAYTDRLKWDGGSTGLVAATGRTSLGATTVGSNLFTLTNPSAITFLRVNADNSVSALSANDFKTALSLNNVENVALSTWAGSTNITTVGVLANGVYSSTAPTLKVGDGQYGLSSAGNQIYLHSAATGQPYHVAGGGTPSLIWTAANDGAGSGLDADLLDGQHASAFSPVAGSSSIATVGTITSGTWNGTAVTVAYGGTGSTTAAGARTNLGATTVGSNLFTLTNPSAITFLRVNADNSVSALDAATFRSAIGAGTGNGSVTSVSGTGTVNGLTLTGTVTSSGSLTLGGTLSGISLTSQVTGTLPVANGGTGITTLTNNQILWVESGVVKQTSDLKWDGYHLLVASSTGLGTSQAGVIVTQGYRGRTGFGGSEANTFNIAWNGSGANLWIDTSNVGQIQTTSDYRIKQNVRPMVANASDRVRQLRPVLYESKDVEIFKSDGLTREGFIAHELQAIIESAVQGEKDALTPDGKIQPQTLNLAPIVAVLTKCVQEILDRVDRLDRAYP